MSLTEADLQGLHPDVVDAIQRPQQDQARELSGLGAEIAKLRDDAVKARDESGIEKLWMKCEEAYLGIDDTNRGEFDGARWAKPMTMEGGLIARRSTDDDTRATAFVRLTSRYVDAGTAKICEIALPIDGKAFTLNATPVPELVDSKDDTTPAQDVTGQAMPGHDGTPVTVGQLVTHAVQQAEDAAEKAASRVNDWMVEYKHPAEMRKVIFDMARIGAGVLKGPIPEVRRDRAITKMPNGSVKLTIVEKVKPAARWIDPWRFYPAPGCGEDIHAGGYAFDADPMLADELMALADLPPESGWLPDAIKQVIAEGPTKAGGTDAGPTKPHKKQFMVWHFNGKISKSAFRAANAEQAKGLDETEATAEKVSAIVTLVNDRVIRAVLQPLESGRLPYNVGVWRRRAGHWAGVGVGEQIDAAQRICNGATRAMLKNGGLSAGAQVVMDEEAVEPADGTMKVTPDKLWFLRKGGGIDDVRKAFQAFQWPNMTPQLMSIVEYSFRLAEEHSSIPLITQGQSGKETPDTFGGQQLQDNNANQLLRDVGFGLNDQITTPLVDNLYEWLLLDPDVPNDEKGDFQVDTSGARALIEKALHDMFLPQLLTASLNPVFELNPAKVMQEMIRSKHMAPSAFRFTDAELDEKKKQAPPPPIPVQVAQIRAQSAEKIATSDDQLQAEKVRADTDRDTAYNNSLAERDRVNAEAKHEQLQLQERIANLNYQTKLAEFAMQEKISLEQAKTKLADTALKLNVQKELSIADMGAQLHKHHNPPPVITPPTEPAGRAAPGKAFQQ